MSDAIAGTLILSQPLRPVREADVPYHFHPADTRKRICTICGRDQTRDGNASRCLYCHGPLFPRGYSSRKRRGFTFPCPHILFHHRSQSECPTCQGRNIITIYGVGWRGASAVFDRIVAFAMQHPARQNVLIKFGESQ